ncbi:MAG: hypothetical protein ACM3O3_04740 [Syntrophothermus sp.]
MKRGIAVLLALCFLMSVTVTAVSASGQSGDGMGGCSTKNNYPNPHDNKGGQHKDNDNKVDGNKGGQHKDNDNKGREYKDRNHYKKKFDERHRGHHWGGHNKHYGAAYEKAYLSGYKKGLKDGYNGDKFNDKICKYKYYSVKLKEGCRNGYRDGYIDGQDLAEED